MPYKFIHEILWVKHIKKDKTNVKLDINIKKVYMWAANYPAKTKKKIQQKSEQVTWAFNGDSVLETSYHHLNSKVLTFYVKEKKIVAT